MKDPYIEYPLCKFKVGDMITHKNNLCALTIISIDPLEDNVCVINLHNNPKEYTLSEINEDFIKFKF